VAVCRWIHRGPDLDPALVAAGMHSCKVRQMRAVVSNFNDGNGLGQWNTPTFPGYPNDEFISFQQQDTANGSIRKFFGSKEKTFYFITATSFKIIAIIICNYYFLSHKCSFIFWNCSFNSH